MKGDGNQELFNRRLEGLHALRDGRLLLPASSISIRSTATGAILGAYANALDHFVRDCPSFCPGSHPTIS
jgi:hypothetical protein